MLAHLKTTLSSISYFSNSHWRPFIDNWKKLCMCRHDHKANQDGMFPLGGWRHYCCILVDILRSQGYAHNRFLTSHPKDQWLYHLWSLKIVKDDIKSPQNKLIGNFSCGFWGLLYFFNLASVEMQLMHRALIFTWPAEHKAAAVQGCKGSIHIALRYPFTPISPSQAFSKKGHCTYCTKFNDKALYCITLPVNLIAKPTEECCMFHTALHCSLQEDLHWRVSRSGVADHHRLTFTPFHPLSSVAFPDIETTANRVLTHIDSRCLVTTIGLPLSSIVSFFLYPY